MLTVLFISLTLVSATADDAVTCSGIVRKRHRSSRISIMDFGGIGDGETLNTKAFQDAIQWIKRQGGSGGTLLYIPPGVYLSERFNLTSHMTLFLAKDAVIKATKNTSNWPLADPLPSYGRGRERPGGRYMSFILGHVVRDVIITGDNGTIDGEGDVWWNKIRKRTLKYTRPHLIEFMYSRDIIIANLTFKDSPFWNIHPVYCSNVVVRHVAILAPAHSPNTDGVDPDSSSNVCIEDSYISTGDDLVAVKSGWDEYGIAYGHPSSNITIRRLTGSSQYAGIAIGSETSGGVENVLAEHINLSNMGMGIHIKTNVGRGAYIRNITISDVYIENAKEGIRIAGNVADHPDDKYDPNALPIVHGITLKNITGKRIRRPGQLRGISNAPFTNIYLADVNFKGSKPRSSRWECSDVQGSSSNVSPRPCSQLISTKGTDTCSVQSRASLLC